jgi:hypothetical protein
LAVPPPIEPFIAMRIFSFFSILHGQRIIFHFFYDTAAQVAAREQRPWPQEAPPTTTSES